MFGHDSSHRLAGQDFVIRRQQSTASRVRQGAGDYLGVAWSNHLVRCHDLHADAESDFIGTEPTQE